VNITLRFGARLEGFKLQDFREINAERFSPSLEPRLDTIRLPIQGTEQPSDMTVFKSKYDRLKIS